MGEIVLVCVDLGEHVVHHLIIACVASGYHVCSSIFSTYERGCEDVCWCLVVHRFWGINGSSGKFYGSASRALCFFSSHTTQYHDVQLTILRAILYANVELDIVRIKVGGAGRKNWVPSRLAIC